MTKQTLKGEQQSLFALLSAAALAAVVTFEKRYISRRTKFSRGECHIFKDGTGIILLGRYAHLIRNAIFRSVYKILCGSDYSYYRKDAQRYSQITSFGVRKVTVDSGGNALGNIVAAATAATAAIICFSDLAVENDGFYYLYDSGGNVLGSAAKLGDGTVVGSVTVALEYAHVALAAVEYHSLFKHRDALELLRFSAAKACLKGYLNVEFDINGIKSAVEFYRVYTDICPSDAGALGTHVCSMLDYIVSEVGQEHLYVLEAVFIATGIQNAVHLYADRFIF